MADMDQRNRQAPAAAPSVDTGISLEGAGIGRAVLDEMTSFASHALLAGAEVVEAIRTGSAIIARTAPGTAEAYGKEQDETPSSGYVGGINGHVSVGSRARSLDLEEHSPGSQRSSGVTVAHGGLRFGSSLSSDTEVAGPNDDSVAIGRIYPARRVAA